MRRRTVTSLALGLAWLAATSAGLAQQSRPLETQDPEPIGDGRVSRTLRSGGT